MIRFSIHLDPENNITRVKSFPEGPEPILIGRDKDCQLRLRNNSVSRHHCRLEFFNNNYIVEDLASTQGTRLNGEPLTPRVSVPVHHGDILQVGELSMLIAILEEPESAEQLSNAAHQAVSNLLGKFLQSPSSDTTAYLKILNGDDEGLKFLLTDKNSWNIGRLEDNDFVIHASSISRQHARITLDSGSYYLQDLGSTSGTTVNGANITGPYHLVHLDRLTFGAVKVIFFDPSQELLSALEYVEQASESSETKALNIKENATVPPHNSPDAKDATNPAFTEQTAENEVTSPGTEPEISADAVANALAESTAQDFSAQPEQEEAEEAEEGEEDEEIEEVPPAPVIPAPVMSEATVSARSVRHQRRGSDRGATKGHNNLAGQPAPVNDEDSLGDDSEVDDDFSIDEDIPSAPPVVSVPSQGPVKTNVTAPTIVRKKRRRLPVMPIALMLLCLTVMVCCLIFFILNNT